VDALEADIASGRLARGQQSAPSGSGRCSFRASSRGAVIQVSTSSGLVRITGIAFGWMAPTSASGARGPALSLKFTFIHLPGTKRPFVRYLGWHGEWGLCRVCRPFWSSRTTS